MGVFIMIIKTTNKLATSLIIISSLMALPNISYSKEVKNEDFLAKLLSSFTSKNEAPKTTQIFEADIKSIKLTSIDDFEFSIKDVLKNYFDIKTVNKIINNISSEDDKTIQAKNIEEFLKLLPKSPSDKVNGAALIRLANQLSTNLKTIYEIKRNIAFQFVQSQGITLVLNDKTERPKITEVKKEEELDTKEASSSMGWIAALAGVGLAGGGGGGGSSSGSISDGTYRNTISGNYGTEYNRNDALAFQNILTLNDYGYTGNGIKVAVVDTGIDASHQEFDGKTIYGVDYASSVSSYNEDEDGHGTHVASIIAGERDESGMRGMAYDATLYSYKVDDGNGVVGLEGLSSDAAIASIFNRHVTDNINVSNNSWGGSTAITSASESAIRASYPSTITAMRAAQNNGTIIVFASGNDSRSEVDSWGGSPYRISELVNEWLVVTSVDSDGIEPSYTNRCGVSSAFCVTAHRQQLEVYTERQQVQMTALLAIM